MLDAPPIRRPAWKWLIPSGGASLLMHAAVWVTVVFLLKGCQTGGQPESGGENFRSVGLAYIDESDGQTDRPNENTTSEVDRKPVDGQTTPVDAVQPPIPLPEVAPDIGPFVAEPSSADINSLPMEIPNVIGMGNPITGLPPSGGGAPLPQAVDGASGQSASGTVTPGPGETAFMNIIGTGQSFVYVIDVSSSMKTNNRMADARAQLKRSLRYLDAGQRFQIIFYNDRVTHLRIPRSDTGGMYAATADRTELAAKRIDTMLPSGGTVHFQPLADALEYKPDVIYFLTDGEEPALRKGELTELRNRNSNAAQIHVIEFATGPAETRDLSWLKLLARQSNGKYLRLD